jgi:RNA 3'-terminal phosphate cyclase
MNLIELDGSTGEGGGQILRTRALFADLGLRA